jgi:hypothetical protein
VFKLLELSVMYAWGPTSIQSTTLTSSVAVLVVSATAAAVMVTLPVFVEEGVATPVEAFTVASDESLTDHVIAVFVLPVTDAV